MAADAAITNGYIYFFGRQHFGMHMAMIVTLAATLALVVVTDSRA